LVSQGYRPATVSKVLQVGRASLYREKSKRQRWPVNDDRNLEGRLRHWREKYPWWGYRKITALIRSRDGLVVNHKRVYRVMKELGLLGRRLNREPVKHDGRFELPEGPNQLWQADLTKVWTEERGWVNLIAIIDVYDRFVLAHGLKLRGRAVEAAEVLDEALNRCFPDGARESGLKVMTDQGSCFTGYAFKQMIKQIDLTHRLTRRRTPQHNAFIESFFAQLKREEVWPNEYHYLQDAETSIGRYVKTYNHERPHGQLGMLTPAQVRQMDTLHKKAA